MYKGQFFESFSVIEDKREEGKVRHKLIDIIFLVVASVICGCNEWKEIHLWATMEVNISWMQKYIDLSNGIPSLSTIGRLFNIISPKQFEKCFSLWMEAAVTLEKEDIISIDGKTMCGSIDKTHGKRGTHIVSALCNSHSLVIGQVKTEEKSNEITAIPELLDILFIEGCVVTIDAMGAQKKIAKKIVNDCKADYVLNVKGNQETLMNEIQDHFETINNEGKIENLKLAYELTKSGGKPLGNEILSMIKTVEKGHGRIEKRWYYYSTDIKWMIDATKDWAGLSGIGMVVRETEISGKKSVETSFYIGSIISVKTFEKAVRNHWKVESMHWSLDVTYKDDANRTRKGTAPQNLAILKRIAFNSVKNDTQIHPKQSMKGKRFIALMDFKYRDFLIDLNFSGR